MYALENGSEIEVQCYIQNLEELLFYSQLYALVKHEDYSTFSCYSTALCYNGSNAFFSIKDYDDEEDHEIDESEHTVNLVIPNQFEKYNYSDIKLVTARFANINSVVPNYKYEFPAFVSFYSVDSFDRHGSYFGDLSTFIPESVKEKPKFIGIDLSNVNEILDIRFQYLENGSITLTLGEDEPLVDWDMKTGKFEIITTEPRFVKAFGVLPRVQISSHNDAFNLLKILKNNIKS